VPHEVIEPSSASLMLTLFPVELMRRFDKLTDRWVPDPVEGQSSSIFRRRYFAVFKAAFFRLNIAATGAKIVWHYLFMLPNSGGCIAMKSITVGNSYGCFVFFW
jgi:hypothetical protein